MRHLWLECLWTVWLVAVEKVLVVESVVVGWIVAATVVLVVTAQAGQIEVVDC